MVRVMCRTEGRFQLYMSSCVAWMQMQLQLYSTTVLVLQPHALPSISSPLNLSISR